MKPRFVLALALALPPSPALASTATELAGLEARLKACIDKDGSNAGMQACTGDAYKAADGVLTRVYRTVVAGLKEPAAGDDGAEKLKRLVAAERAWIAYRDAECELRGTEMLGGSGEALVAGTCLFDLTRQRAKALNDLFRAP